MTTSFVIISKHEMSERFSDRSDTMCALVREGWED